MNTKSLWSLCMFLLACSFISRAQTTTGVGQHKGELDIVFQAFKAKNYELIKPLLDPQVKIDELPKGMNDIVVPQILNQLPEPSSYTVASVVRESDSTRVNTTYRYSDGSARTQSFLFNADDKIIEMDVLNDAKTVTTKSACAPERTIERDVKRKR